MNLIKQDIEKLRTRLLDLSKRNNLLNFRHSERARHHVRVIDELPDFLFEFLRNGKTLTFAPLPELDGEPKDEQTDEFRLRFEAALLTDEIYKEAIDALDENDEDNVNKIYQLERELKDRIRAELNMPPRKDTKEITNRELAKMHVLNPSYEMPVIDMRAIEEDKHQDNLIQTLLRPKELERKLSGLYDYYRTDLAESGTNTLYVAFGFLEWYERDGSEKPLYSPLLLLQLEMKKKESAGGYTFSISSTGEEAEINLSLQEKLKRDFGMELPKYDPEDTPESYMLKMQEFVKKKKGWKVRRYITVGRFRFSRLVMYHDLSESRWYSQNGIADTAIIQKLFTGGENDIDHDAEEYEIDSEEIDREVPVLITDADSSQHSAIIDVIRGKNLVIKGPPGTGKSQTITNIIAAALAKDKKVLFVAEKMAALEVVYNRLTEAGLGDFCLELHSTKVKKKDVIESLKKRLDISQPSCKPGELKTKLQELKKLRGKLSYYVDVLNSEFGQIGKTVHNIIWSAQLKKDKLTILSKDIGHLRIPDARVVSQVTFDECINDLDLLEEYYRESFVDGDINPWSGVYVSSLTPFKQQELIENFETWKNILENLLSELKDISKKVGWNIPENISEVEKFTQFISGLEENEIPLEMEDIFYKLNTVEKVDSLNKFIETVQCFNNTIESITPDIRVTETLLTQADEIEQLVETAKKLGVLDKNLEDLQNILLSIDTEIKGWEGSKRLIEELLSVFNLSTPPKVDVMLDLIALVEFSSKIPREFLLLRNDELTDEINSDFLKSILKKHRSILDKKELLSQQYDLSIDINPTTLKKHLMDLRSAGILWFFKPSVHRTRKIYKLLCKSKIKSNNLTIAAEMQKIAELKEEIRDFEDSKKLQQIAGTQFYGINTDVEMLLAVNDWAVSVQKRFAGTSPHLEEIRKILIHGDIQKIDAFTRFADDLYVQDLISRHSQNEDLQIPEDINHLDYINVLKDYRELFTRLWGKLKEIQASEELTYNIIRDNIELIKKVARAKEEIDESADIASILDTEFKGRNTDIDALSSVIHIAGAIHKNIESTSAIGRIFAADGLSILTYLRGRSLKIREILDDEKEIREHLENFASMDTDVFFNVIDSYVVEDISKNLECINNALKEPKALKTLVDFNTKHSDVEETIAAPVIEFFNARDFSFHDIRNAFEFVFYTSLLDEVYEAYPGLADYQGISLEKARSDFRRVDREVIALQRRFLYAHCAKGRPVSGTNRGNRSSWTEHACLNNEIRKKRQHIPIRNLLQRAGHSIQNIKPCFMMSPLSVAQYLIPEKIKFDLIVIDEASQMRPEDALGALARAEQVIVVGDPKQLPPTSFFRDTLDEEEEDADAIDSESILDMSINTFRPTRSLRWHYRSRHESLIAFSNYHYYDNNLIIFPSPKSDSDKTYGLQCRYVGGTYSAQTNEDEVKAIIDATRQFMHSEMSKPPECRKSLGIASMNLKQKELIRNGMDRLFIEDSTCRAYETFWEEKLEKFFIKNLENVQGDERDTIFISTVYGPEQGQTKVMQRFGPINSLGGHRRLNVLFTRAKMNTVIFTSLRPSDIVGASEGAQALKGFLQYANGGVLDGGEETGSKREPDSDFEVWVKERLEQIGCEVVPQVGVAGFFIDLGVKHPQYPNGFLLGVECDGATYHSSKSARDRDRIRQEVLENLGWNIYRIWSTDWFANSDHEMKKLKRYIENLLEEHNTKKTLLQPTASNNVYSQEQSQETPDRLSHILDRCPQKALKSNTSNQTEIESEVMIEDVEEIVEIFDTVTYTMPASQNKKRRVQVVPHQGNVDEGTISKQSAVGRALLGSAVGEEIEIILPTGETTIIIDSIEKSSI